VQGPKGRENEEKTNSLKEKAMIPPADVLEKQVTAVIHALMKKDLHSHQNGLIGLSSDEVQTRFFKSGAPTLNTTMNPRKHVKKGSLSDHPSIRFQILGPIQNDVCCLIDRPQ